MKLSFFGAAHAVTGSCHCLEANGRKILIDCGLQQGRDEHDDNALDFAPGQIDYCLVTHAHIDHSGRLPLLVKEGFQGQIITTRLTAQLLSIMLRDSAHIQESDAQWQNQKGKRAGRDAVEPLYTVADAEAVLQQLYPVEYGQVLDLCEGVRVRFTDAGHLLGSSEVELWLTEGDVERKIVFSGDLGNIDQPIIRDPSFVEDADYVVMESTYGDRNHEPPESYTESLAQLIDEVFAKGGNIVIPSFAVGRTQELLYFLREIKDRGLVKSAPNFTVCVDSPLAAEATRVYSGDLHGYLDEEAIAVLQGGDDLFTFPGLILTQSTEESKALNMDPSPKIIISASGMCDAGRIRHHLKHNLWRPECAVVFVGYQAEGTLGRRLLEGAKTVKLFGEEIAVLARIVNFKGLSSHADRDHLLEWVGRIAPAPRQVFVVHGDAPVTELFAEDLNQRGIPAHAPLYQEVYDLAADRMLAKGVVLESKRTTGGASAPSAAYVRLVDVTKQLQDMVGRSRGRANKDLGRLADQLKAIMEKCHRAGERSVYEDRPKRPEGAGQAGHPCGGPRVLAGHPGVSAADRRIEHCGRLARPHLPACGPALGRNCGMAQLVYLHPADPLSVGDGLWLSPVGPPRHPQPAGGVWDAAGGFRHRRAGHCHEPADPAVHLPVVPASDLCDHHPGFFCP